MDFAHPYILYALLLIIPLTGLYFMAMFSRRRKLKLFGRPSSVEPMIPMASRYKPAIKFILEILALSCLIIAIARPRYGMHESTEERKGIEVMIAVDVSNSMLASATDDNAGVSRLQRAKFLLGKLVDRLDNDRVGLIVFAGSASTQLPLTTDFISAKMYINDMSTTMINNQGTNIGEAIRLALDCFSQGNDVNKAIVLITDSEDHDGNAVNMARHAHSLGVQVDVIGVGTERGALIPLDASRGVYMKDAEGRPVTTSFNAQVAKEVAEAGGGIFVDGSSSNAISSIEDCLDNIAKTNLGPVTYSAGAERFPIFIWIALLLIIVDIFVLDRKIGWLQKINFFSKPAK